MINFAIGISSFVLGWVLARKQSKSDIAIFLDEYLTETEKENLLKRIGS